MSSTNLEKPRSHLPSETTESTSIQECVWGEKSLSIVLYKKILIKICSYNLTLNFSRISAAVHSCDVLAKCCNVVFDIFICYD